MPENVFLTAANETMKQLPKGVFLSVGAEDKINTMTIGWGALGYIWAKPVLMVMVRYSRYTYELIEKALDFSVSVPLPGTFMKELAGVGTQSGRDVDKFNSFNLKVKKGRKINSPVIGDCGLIYECRIIYKQALDPRELDSATLARFYDSNDFHMMYLGEIVDFYRNKEHTPDFQEF